jgi:hypothetical protein
MPYIPTPPPIRRGMGELTDEKREYLKELHQWLADYPEGEEFHFPNGIMREREFFLDLVDKVRIIEGYSSTDRVWLDLITREHSKWKKNVVC